jgi:hypothetical protein
MLKFAETLDGHGPWIRETLDRFKTGLPNQFAQYGAASLEAYAKRTAAAELPTRPVAAARPARPLGAGAARRAPSNDAGGDGALPKGEKTLLIAIAQYPDGAEREQLTVLTGYKRSSRDTYIQRLSSRGYVEANGNGTIIATGADIDALGNDYEPLPTGTELQAYWLNRLGGGEKRILEVLLESGGDPMARADLDERVGYQRSSRDTYLQRLSSRRLVENVGRGEVRASPTLFG